MSAEPDLMRLLLDEGKDQSQRLPGSNRWLVAAAIANLTLYGLLVWCLS